ncbi:hypothetical protein RJT34_26670 [Clitoria ternatea]|uniref:Uncharacterized protein n=1 Tax=Clitoria ternatea TaxID=43366 RepID=A0AAN9FFT4_CLITE
MMQGVDCCINSYWFVALLKLLLYTSKCHEFPCTEKNTIVLEFNSSKAVHDLWLCTSAMSPEQPFMGTFTKVSAFAFLFVYLANSLVHSSITEPTISGYPTALPYVTAPDIASFFPTPTAEEPMDSAAPPDAEASAPAPSSGEFVGKKSSSSPKLDCAAASIGILLFSFFIINKVV